MKASIEEGCIGCGLCAGSCPEVFRMNDNNLAEVYASADKDPEGTQEAADNCPVSVILVE